MSESTRNLRIPLHVLNRDRLASSRCGEPVVVGVSLPRGAVRSGSLLGAVDTAGRPVPMAARVLDTWPDGSARWVSCEMAVDADSQTDIAAMLCAGSQEPSVTTTLRVETCAGGIRVHAGRGVFEVAAGCPFPFGRVAVDHVGYLDEPSSGLRLDLDGRPLWIAISSVSVVSASALRAVVRVQGLARGNEPCALHVEARLEFFAGQATVRAEITLRNSRPAQHPGGRWVLGDSGSVQLRSSVCRLPLTGGVHEVHARVDAQTDDISAPPPFELHQESSGGEAWNSRVHVNVAGKVPLRYRGYIVRAGSTERRGLRALPVVRATGPAGALTVAVPAFWQNFPQSITVDDAALTCQMFPADVAEPFELQGGEQKTHTIVVSFTDDTVSAEPLAWVHEPVLLSPPPAWTASTGAVPFLEEASRDPFEAYQRLVDSGLDATHGLAAKRELADEYGWRNFGDLPADHESAFLAAGQVNVSHYNNQYDALACFAIHFLRSGDPRWHALMCELAAHVRDIDIYHTEADKSAYSGGLFWHTDHYLDAGTSTHRTYPSGSRGGGPSNEHNYNFGLLMHYLLTGDERSRDAAIGLGEWVINMDDGRRTVFRWLASGATGLASATGSSDYHGPGRGAANSILACMVAYRLTGAEKYAAKTEELIRRCVHPEDDLSLRRLDDVERRWYYTVFLQVLGQFLFDKRERSEVDPLFEYARASLLHYSRYIVEHEQPYLDRPDRLDFPTETWVAQDLRKGDALLWAAYFADDSSERERFLKGAERFFDYGIPTLLSMPTHVYTRPTILALGVGWRRAWYAANTLPEITPRSQPAWGAVATFVPQKTVAIRRARIIAAAAAGIAGVAAVLFGTLF